MLHVNNIARDTTQAGRHPCSDQCARLRAALVLMFQRQLGLASLRGPGRMSKHGNDCVRSRGMTGQLDAGVLETRRDENGTNFVDAARAVGYVAEDAQVPCGARSP